MSLQHQRPVGKMSDPGYAMVAILVGIGIMSVMMGLVLPVWRQAAQREKEAELVWRGEQYARAIGLFQRKYGGAFPPNLDLLVEQRFLRRKFRDPMTKDGEFQVLFQAGQATTPGQGASGASARPGSVAPPQAAAALQQTAAGAQPGGAAGPGGTLGARGGITGVASKSKEKSIRLYKGRGNYNEWQFVYVAATTQGGAAPTGQQRPGQSSAPGGRRPGDISKPGSPPSPTGPGSNRGPVRPPMRPPQ
jgi:type II secretory pathway pseudopilin PulG